ncbi:unnamed protein product [Malus baccata var. baccata]
MMSTDCLILCCRFPVSHIHTESVISHLLPNTLDLNHPDSPTCRVYLSFDADWLQLAVDQPFDMDIHVVTRMDPPAVDKLPRRQSVLDVHITAERGPLTGSLLREILTARYMSCNAPSYYCVPTQCGTQSLPAAKAIRFGGLPFFYLVNCSYSPLILI